MMVINSSIWGIFGLFVIIGFLLGLIRGFYKALIRVFTVFLAAVITYFSTTPIVDELFKIDFSALNIDVGGILVTNLDSTIILLLNSIPGISEIMEISPTFQSFILTIPTLIVGLVLFVLVFFIIKALTWIVYLIISSLAIPKKKKDEERKDHRFLGGLVGAFQGIICFVVVLIPILGTVNLVNQTLDTIDLYSNEKTIQSVGLSSNNENDNFTTMSFIEKTDDIQTSIKTKLDTDIIEPYLDNFNNNFIIKTLNWFRVDKLANKVFDKLTTFKVNKEETTLRSEVLILSKLYGKSTVILQYNHNSLNAEQVVVLQDTADIMFESKILKNVVGESVAGIASKWSKPNTTFLGQSKPQLGGELDNVVTSLLAALAIASPDDIQMDTMAIIDILAITSSSDAINSMSGGGSAALNTVGDKKFMVDLIDAMLGGPSIKKTIPTFINSGLSFIYPLIDVPVDSDEIDLRFYQRLVKASTNYVSDEVLEIEYRSAFSYYDVKIYNTLPDTIPDRPYILKNQLIQMIDDCKSFSSEEEYRQYFAENNFEIEGGKVISQKDLRIKKTSNQVNWDTEKYILADIFSGMANAFNATNSKGENKTAIDVLNFNEFANVLTAIRRSELLEGIDQTLILAFLQSSIFEGLQFADSFMDLVKDDQKWQDVNFNSLLSALTIVQDMRSILDSDDPQSSLSEETVSTLVNILTGDDQTTKDAIIDLVNEENLIKSGVDPSLAGAVSELVQGIAGVEDAERSDGDTAAVQNTIEALQNARGEGDIFKDQEASDSFVSSIMSSNLVYSATITNSDNTTFSSANEQDKEYLSNALDSYYTDNASGDAQVDEALEEKLNNIALKFGIEDWSAPSI